VRRDEALQRLPEAYAVALRLHAEGRDDAIAERLGIGRESVGPLLRLAEAKLARLLGSIDVTES
jgi:DNA-directed RNA polymerase specialized sigma24 family protein